jgi:hypothetical protein
MRGDLDRAQSLAEDMLRLGHQRNDAAGLVLGHLSPARILLYRGNFRQSKSHLEAGLALYDPTAHRSLVDQTGIHPQIYLKGYMAWVLFCLGYLDQAFARSNASIAEARRLAHPPSLAAGLAVGSRWLSLDGDDAALNERAEELVAVTTEQGFPAWLATGTAFLGWAKVRIGDVAEGMSLLRSGLAVYRDVQQRQALSDMPCDLTCSGEMDSMRCGSSKGPGSAGSRPSSTGTKAGCC